MLRGLVLLLLLLLTAITTKGLKVGRDISNPCGGGGGSFNDDTLCDPDHLVSPEESYNIDQLLTRCGEAAGHVKVMVFLASSFSFDDVKPTNVLVTSPTITTTDTNQDSGGGSDKSSINLLRELVVSSNKLNSSTISTLTNKGSSTISYSSIILLVAIKDPFQLATWHSAALDGVLTRATLEEAEHQVDPPVDQQHFTSTVVHVAHNLCLSARQSQSRTLRDIILTVVWIAFTTAFVALLLVIVLALLRAHHRAVTSASAKVEQEHPRRTESRRLFPITSTSDIQDLGAVYYTSTSTVLLGTTDITAVPAQDCSSTDNLLQA